MLRILLLSLLLLPPAAAAAADPATDAPAFEPVLVLVVLPDGIHDWHDISSRVSEPVFRRAVATARDRPPALEGWTGGHSASLRGAALWLVGARGPATNAPAALAALRALVAEAAPGFPDGVAPEPELRFARVRRDADGAPEFSSADADLFVAERRLRPGADPDGVRPAWDFSLSRDPDGTARVAVRGNAPPAPGASAQTRQDAARLRALRWLSPETLLLDFGEEGRVAVSRDPATGALSVAPAPPGAPAALPPPETPDNLFSRSAEDRPGVAVAVPSRLAPDKLAAALERPMLAAAARALADALPGRAAPARATFHVVRKELSRTPGCILLAGPLRTAEVAPAEAALAAAFAPDAFPMPEGCGPARVAPCAVRAASPDGPPMPPAGTQQDGPFALVDAERELVWTPAGAGLAPGRHLALAFPCDVERGSGLANAPGSTVRTRAEFGETVLAPVERLAARAGWGAPGARPVRAFHPGLGGALLLPLAPDADADALLADARARVAVVAESFPDSVGTPFADVREVPAPAAAPPAPGAAPGAEAVVRLLLDAVDRDRRGAVPFRWSVYGRWDPEQAAREEARADALAGLPPGLEELLVPNWLEFCAPYGLLDRDAFGPGFPGAFARFATNLVADASIRGLLGADTAQPLSVRFRPLDADARAALLALAPDELQRPGRAFLAVAGFECGGASGRDAATAVLPAVVGDDGEARLLRAPAFATMRRLDPGIPGCTDVVAVVQSHPTFRDPVTDALAAAVLRVAETGDTNLLASLVHPACRAAATPEALAFRAGWWSRLAALGPLEVSFVPATGLGGGIGAVERTDEFGPDFGRFGEPAPLAATIPGLWLRGDIRVRRGGVPLDVGSFTAVLADGAARLHQRPVPPDGRVSRLAVALSSVAERLARRLAVADDDPVADFERPLVAAAARADPPRSVSFAYTSHGPGLSPVLRRHYGIPEADTADDRRRDRTAPRLERIGRGGLATELDASAPLPVVDLAPGETLRLMPATDAAGVTREASVRFVVDPDKPDGTALELGTRDRDRTGSGHGWGAIRIPLARRFGAAPLGYRSGPRLAFVRGAADAPPAAVLGVFPDGPDDTAAALCLAFLEDPEGVLAREAPATLRPFLLRLRPDAEDDPAANPAAAPADPVEALLAQLRDARRRDAGARFAPPERDANPVERVATEPLGETRRLRVALAVEIGADGPTNALPVVLRATASVETRPAPGAEWTPEPGAVVVEGRGVYAVGPDGALALRGDFRGGLSPWGRTERFSAAAGPLGVVLEAALPAAFLVETKAEDFSIGSALSATAVLSGGGDLLEGFADAPDRSALGQTATLLRGFPAIRLVRPEP